MAGSVRRATPQRDAVVELLGRAERFLSAQAIRERLQTSVSLATVYRTLQDLASSGEIDRLHAGAGGTLYRLRPCAHRVHLRCRSCGSTVPVDSDGLEASAIAIAAAHGFTDVIATIRLSGVCPRCGSCPR